MLEIRLKDILYQVKSLFPVIEIFVKRSTMVGNIITFLQMGIKIILRT
jgi:hypothetical protein